MFGAFVAWWWAQWPRWKGEPGEGEPEYGNCGCDLCGHRRAMLEEIFEP